MGCEASVGHAFGLFFDPGGRPGPRGLRRRLRPFLAFFFGPPTAPSNPWTAPCTCSRTRCWMTLTKLVGRGIRASLLRGGYFTISAGLSTLAPGVYLFCDNGGFRCSRPGGGGVWVGLEGVRIPLPFISRQKQNGY